ncbi:MAG TPA: zinc-binding dehydrogenase, partial [Acidimicrobiales bacterium]|nr:zinc-binding dehydrogenase [Acidimicrobiales bacterium]
RGLGADHVVDYTTGDFTSGGHRYDAIVDTGGNRRLSQIRGALTPHGRLVIVGGETDGRWLGGADRMLRALLLSPFVGQKLGALSTSENSRDLMVLRELLEAGKITSAIDRSFPLNDVAGAIRRVQEGHARGKVVIAV